MVKRIYVSLEEKEEEEVKEYDETMHCMFTEHWNLTWQNIQFSLWLRAENPKLVLVLFHAFQPSPFSHGLFNLQSQHLSDWTQRFTLDDILEFSSKAQKIE